jgi:4-hydroxy 2-oxovalerate aldolase
MVIKENKTNIKLLDCTLRDGGYVNNFNFGEENINTIVNNLSTTNVDLIELGFLKNGNHSQDQSLFNYVSEAEKFTKHIENNQDFCLMIRPDWYDISKLERCTGKIKFLRFAFHYNDLNLMLQQAEIARSYGYEVFFNPVNVLSYSEEELKQLLFSLNQFKPKGIYIVDTFGSLLPSDLPNIFSIFSNQLDKQIAIGLHLHENLSISLALAINFIDMIKDTRLAYIDCSIQGIGRIPGNLCTELIMGYLNSVQKNTYNLSGVYSSINNPISGIKKETAWGYIPAYAITAFNKMHRSYAEYLMEKPNLSLQDIDTILNKIESKIDREEYNESVITQLYNDFLTNSK